MTDLQTLARQLTEKLADAGVSTADSYFSGVLLRIVDEDTVMTALLLA